MGERINLPYTRAMISAALNGKLSDAPTRVDAFFGLAVPTNVPEVPDQILDPRATWSDASAYDEQAQKLVTSFQENFEQYSKLVSEEIAAAGPKGMSAK